MKPAAQTQTQPQSKPQTPNTPEPTPREKLLATLEAITEDAYTAPEAYLDETIVPEGGE
ncbi:MAG: hypothetical protein AAFS10_02955 [Myxococcota bacterium]